jgi:hypothetical protein
MNRRHSLVVRLPALMTLAAALWAPPAHARGFDIASYTFPAGDPTAVTLSVAAPSPATARQMAVMLNGQNVMGFLFQDLSANPLVYVEGGALNDRRVTLSGWLDSVNPDLTPSSSAAAS